MCRGVKERDNQGVMKLHYDQSSDGVLRDEQR